MDPDSYLCRLAELFDGITIYSPSVGAIIAIILAVLLLFASGFVSASEIAFFSLSPNDLSEIEEEEHSSDKRIMALLEDSERLLATILISNNFVNVTIIMLCNYFFAEVVDFGGSVIVEFLVITVILTFLLLLWASLPSPAQLVRFAPGRSRLRECGSREWCLTGASAQLSPSLRT